jgi:V/A-type H+-transporting ATPase subunit D
MAEAGGEVLATRVAFLELKDERRLIQEGYELLDEKRVLLATEIMRQLRSYASLQQELERLGADALAAFEAAVGVHGFDELTVEPKLDLGPSLLRVHAQSFLGLRLAEAVLEVAAPPTDPARRPATPEARACATAFRRLIERQAELAACVANLRRLVREYVRTERRARALENVVLPEIDGSLRFIEEQLDAVDQEEAVRVRNAGAARD